MTSQILGKQNVNKMKSWGIVIIIIVQANHWFNSVILKNATETDINFVCAASGWD